MSGWVALALLVGSLIVVALIVLAADVLRGDVGGGRHTLARARRLLVIATDESTETGAERWIDEQQRERPELQCFIVHESDGQQLWMAIQEAIARESPDAIVFARHDDQPHAMLDGVYGRLKEEHLLPVDAIYVGAEGST